MYHHLNSDRCSNDVEIFDEHLRYIKDNFETIFPGEKVGKNSVCLTFDDAYADFYFLTYPLLQKYNLKATLAVPTKFILEDTNIGADERMKFEHNDLFENFHFGTFCTFKELKQMMDSNLVQIASHSHSHVDMTADFVDVQSELCLSKQILQEKLGAQVDSFFFPYGKYNKEILSQTLKNYKYAFRIGNAVHSDFNGINGVIYRVDGDGLKSPDEIFKFKKMLGYKLKATLKRFKS